MKLECTIEEIIEISRKFELKEDKTDDDFIEKLMTLDNNTQCQTN